MMRILIVDDHVVVREGIKKILSFETDIEVCVEACSAEEALDMLDGDSFDVLVLDVTLPGRSGLDILVDIRARFQNTRSLVLSMHPEEVLALRALRAGAAEYLSKDFLPQELVAAIRRIHSGKKFITSTVAERLADVFDGAHTENPQELLSAREYEVMIHIANGLKTSEIAALLNIGERTVGTYRRRVLEKLALRSTADIIHYAIDNGLISISGRRSSPSRE